MILIFKMLYVVLILCGNSSVLRGKIDPNSDGMQHNIKATVGKINECPEYYPITYCAQSMDGVLGG